MYSSRNVNQKVDCVDQELRRTTDKDVRFSSIWMTCEALEVDDLPWSKMVGWQESKVKNRFLWNTKVSRRRAALAFLWGKKRFLKGFRKQATCDHSLTWDDKIESLILCFGLECQSLSKYSFKALLFQLKKNILISSRCEEDSGPDYLPNVITVSLLFLPFFGNTLPRTCFFGNMPSMHSLQTALILFLDNILTHIIEKGSFMIGVGGK